MEYIMKKLTIVLLAFFLTLNAQAKVKNYKKREVVLSSDNTLVLNTSFNKRSVSKLMQTATAMDANLKSGYPMYLFMYTPGGGIQSSLELIEYLKGLNRPIHTVTLFAASMGFQTVQHLGKRYIMK